MVVIDVDVDVDVDFAVVVVVVVVVVLFLSPLFLFSSRDETKRRSSTYLEEVDEDLLGLARELIHLVFRDLLLVDFEDDVEHLVDRERLAAVLLRVAVERRAVEPRGQGRLRRPRLALLTLRERVVWRVVEQWPSERC